VRPSRVQPCSSPATISAFPASTGRSARTSPFSRRAQRSLTLRPAYSPSHQVTLYTEGFSHFVTSMTAPVASGGSKNRRAGFAPAGKAPPFHGARRRRRETERSRSCGDYGLKAICIQVHYFTSTAIGDADIATASNGSYHVTIPIKITRRGRRKAVTLPDGTAFQPRAWDRDPTPTQQALAEIRTATYCESDAPVKMSAAITATLATTKLINILSISRSYKEVTVKLTGINARLPAPPRVPYPKLSKAPLPPRLGCVCLAPSYESCLARHQCAQRIRPD